MAYTDLRLLTLFPPPPQGFQNKTVSETSLPLEELDNLIEEVQVYFNVVCL